MISNQYQNQPNFNGNLLKEGIRLPQKKFNEVAKIYAAKTKGMPDLTLKGIRSNSDFDGYFFHSTHAIMNGEDVASIVTGTLKSMFKDCSAKKTAREFVNITKGIASLKQEAKLVNEIADLQGRLQNLKLQIKHTENAISKKRLKVLLDRMETTLAKKQAELNKVRSEEITVSGEWCI
jgi:hypothetical protein